MEEMDRVEEMEEMGWMDAMDGMEEMGWNWGRRKEGSGSALSLSLLCLVPRILPSIPATSHITRTALYLVILYDAKVCRFVKT